MTKILFTADIRAVSFRDAVLAARELVHLMDKGRRKVVQVFVTGRFLPLRQKNVLNGSESRRRGRILAVISPLDRPGQPVLRQYMLFIFNGRIRFIREKLRSVFENSTRSRIEMAKRMPEMTTHI